MDAHSHEQQVTFAHGSASGPLPISLAAQVLGDSALEDDTNSWILGADGQWTRSVPAKPAKPHSHHATMMRRALKRARRGARERRPNQPTD